MRRFSFHTVLILFPLILGCASYQPIQKGDTLSAETAETLLERWNSLFPTECMLSQRIVLHVRGRVYDFTGAAAVRKPDQFRIMALGDMGGLLFDFLIADTVTVVKKKPPGMPVAPLYRGVCSDILFLYGLHTGHLSATRLDSGRLACTLFNGDEEQTCIFDKAFRPLFSYTQKGRRRIRTVDYSAFGKAEGDTAYSPARIVLVNDRYHYRMEIETSKIQPIIPGNTVFQ